MADQKINKPKFGALAIAGIYLLISSVWILLSDKFVGVIASDRGTQTTLSTLKGWGFVAVTALLLYWLIQRYTTSLRENEQRMAAILNSAMDAVLSIDNSNRIVLFNPAAERMFGYTADEIIGQSLDILIPELYRTKHHGQINDFGRTGITSRHMNGYLEIAGIKKNGVQFPIDISISQVDTDAGKIFTAILRDITERKQTAESLRKIHDELEVQFQQRTAALSEANALLETMLEHIPDQIYFKDAESRFIKNSKAQAMALGLSDTSQVVGKTDFDFFPHAQRSFDEEQEIIRTGKPLVDFEERVVWPDGKETWVSTSKVPLRNHERMIIGTFGISRDITDRKRAEESLRKAKEGLEFKVIERTAELREANKQLELELDFRKKTEEALRASEYNYRSILEQASDGIFIADATGKYIEVNPSGCDMLGYTREEMLTKKMSDLIPPEDLTKVPVRMDELIQGKTFLSERRMIRKDGTRLQVEISARMLSDGRFQGIVRDITERKRAEQEILSLSRFPEENPNPVLRVTRDGEILYSNQAGANILKTWKQEIHQAVPDEWQAHIKQLLESGLNSEVEIESFGKIFSCILSSVKDADYINIYGREITEQNRTQAALQKSEQRFREIFENTNDAIYIWSLGDDGTIARGAEVNDVACKRMGYSKEEFLQLSPAAINAGNIREKLPAMVAPLLSQGQMVTEAFHRTKDGKIIPVEISSRIVELIGEKKIISLARDITERKQAEEKLAASQKLLQDITDNSISLIYALDLAGRFLLINRKLESVFNTPRETMIGQTREVAMPLEIAAAHRANDLQIIAERMPITFEEENDEPDGKHTYLSVKFPLMDLHGDLYGIAGISTDISGRKQAEDALKTSETKYRRLFETAKDGILILDAETAEIRDVNVFLKELLGYPQSGFLGKQLWELGLFKDIVANQESFQELKEKEYIRYDDLPLKTRDGRTIWVEFVSNVYSVGDRKVMQCNIRDITERKQAEETLAKNRSMLHEMGKMAKVGGWEFEAETRQQIWTDEVYRIHEVDKTYEPTVDKGIAFYAPAAQPVIGQAVQRAIAYGEPFDLELEFITAEGNHRWVHSLGNTKQENGKTKTVYGAFQDITERKQAEEEIRQLNETLEQRIVERTAELSDLYNNAPCGYHSLNADGVFVHINQTELNWLGYRLDELIRKVNITSILTPASVEIFKKNFPVFKETGVLNNLELDMIRKDATIMPILLSATAVRDAEGRYVESRTTLVDYTEQKHIEEEMLKSRTQLEATNKELEAFAYSVSHDLRSPLRGIDGWSMALLEDYGPILDEQGLAHIQKVRAEAQRMGTLIDDILQLSRITRAEMNKEKVDLSAIAETVAARLQETKPEDRQVDFVIEKGLTALGDPKLLDVVLTNLLGNAFKFTGKLERSYIEFGQTVVEGKPAFYVRDNGAGFDMTYANKLFGAFQRMHRASEFPGTGVGLATVQRVVNRHGGSIWASSEVGMGATFYFTLEDNNK